MAGADGNWPSPFLQHRVLQVFVPIIRVIGAVSRVLGRVIARAGLAQRFAPQGAAPWVGPAGRSVHGGQPHAPRGAGAPHVRVTGHFMTFCNRKYIIKYFNSNTA